MAKSDLKLELKNRKNASITRQIARDPTGYIISTLRGVLYDSNSVYDLLKQGGFLSLGVAKGYIHGHGIHELLLELESKRQKGEVVNYLDENIGRDTFSDFITSLEQDGLPTTDKLEILRALLLAALDSNSEDKRRRVARELIKIASALTSIDIQILKLVAERGSEMKREKNGEINFHGWRNWIINKLGDELEGVIVPAIDRLRSVYLIHNPNSSDLFVGDATQHCGLTKTGMALLDYISEYGGSEA